MIIGVDGQLLTGSVTGMGVVLRNILTRISIPDGNKLILYINDDINKELKEKLESTNGIHIKRLPYSNYLMWEQVILPNRVKKDGLDVFWFPNNTSSLRISCKTIVTIHDLIFMEGSIFSPKTIYKKLGKIYRRWNVPQTIDKAYKIITISQYTKDQIVKLNKKSKNKISVCYNGCEYSDKYLTERQWYDFVKSNEIGANYILAFGSLEQRKNTYRSILAFQKMSKLRPDLHLVLFGFRGYEKSDEYKYICDNNIKNVHFLGYVSEEEKGSLYKHSKCFLFPSLSEGFGIPILEAYYNKTPVVTSDCSSMPEIAGNAAYLVNPNSVDSISNGLLAALTNDNSDRIKNGVERTKVFDWDKTSKKVSEILFNRG